MHKKEFRVLIEVEKRDNFAEILGLLTGFHEQSTIVKGKANDLLYMRNNVPIAQSAISLCYVTYHYQERKRLSKTKEKEYMKCKILEK